MYWNIFDRNRYDLLKKLSEEVSINDYYMIGGTALSLQLGLRESYDFDFCVKGEFNNELLLEELKKIGNIEVIQNQKGTCDVLLNGVQVSFFYYPNKVLKDFIKVEEMPNLNFASILDIATMKVVAIGGRGAKKDFFDLFNIIKKCNINTYELVEGLKQKCGENIIMGLSYFEDAEDEILPNTFVDYNWGEIKKFFIEFQKEVQNILENN